MSTACGMSHFYENTYIGKALYGLSVSPWNDGLHINGRNTIETRPFNLTINTYVS